MGMKEEINTRKMINQVINEMDSINIENLTQTDLVKKALAFDEENKTVFERIWQIVKDIKTGDLENLENNNLNSLLTFLKSANEYFTQLKSFDSIQNSPKQVSDYMGTTGKTKYNQWFPNIGLPIISYIRKKPNFDALEKQINETKKRNEDVVKEMENKNTEASSILTKMQEAASKMGVTQHAVHFENATTKHDEIAGKWLKATVVLGLLTIGWGIASFYLDPIKLSDKPSDIDIIHSIATKVIILSVLYYGLVWSGRNYNAHRHNAVVNKHRQNALSTFETFVNAAGNDTSTKHAVLLEATHCIFSLRSSGYLRKDTDLEAPNKFIEILRNINPTQKT
ncbi:MAG: hypothetical protein V1871_02030 [Planctomycetota bacterium]